VRGAKARGEAAVRPVLKRIRPRLPSPRASCSRSGRPVSSSRRSPPPRSPREGPWRCSPRPRLADRALLLLGEGEPPVRVRWRDGIGRRRRWPPPVAQRLDDPIARAAAVTARVQVTARAVEPGRLAAEGTCQWSTARDKADSLLGCLRARARTENDPPKRAAPELLSTDLWLSRYMSGRLPRRTRPAGDVSRQNSRQSPRAVEPPAERRIGFAGHSQRRRPESNRCTRLCRPLRNHSATAPWSQA
jgi:hypothetical protein